MKILVKAKKIQLTASGSVDVDVEEEEEEEVEEAYYHSDHHGSILSQVRSNSICDFS